MRSYATVCERVEPPGLGRVAIAYVNFQFPHGNLLKTRAAIMRINENDIMDEVEAHIRKFVGDFGEWFVGTAKDYHGPFFLRHQNQDLGDQMIYREAYTPYAADEVAERLVQGCGLHPDRESARERGRVVFVYRKMPANSTASGDHQQDVDAKLAA